MDKEKLAWIRKIQDKHQALWEAGKDSEADDLYKKHWLAFEYNYNGGWIGSVKNENGWTP